MLPFDDAFRTLALKKIKGLTNKDFMDYEALLAIQFELFHVWREWENTDNDDVKGPKQEFLDRKIREVRTQFEEKIAEFAPQFKAVHDLWIARRRTALRQGNYFQIPFNKKWFKYLWTLIKYRGVQVKTTYLLLTNR